MSSSDNMTLSEEIDYIQGYIALQNIRLERPINFSVTFDLLQELGNPEFQIIFTTFYDEYAICAFKYKTIDSLLKPIIIEYTIPFSSI